MMLVEGKTKKDVVTEFRTAEILAAAHRVFAGKGFHDATIEDVAREAKVAKGTVYLYYRSKNDLYRAALKHGIVEMMERTKQKVEEAASTRAKLLTFLETKIRYFDVNREFFKIYYSEFGNVLTHPLEEHRDFTSLYRRQARMLEEVLDEGLKRKEIRCTRSSAAALAIAELTRGLIIHRLLGWSKGKVEEDISFLFDFVWKGIGRA